MKKIIISLVLLVSIGILSSSFKKTTQQIDVKKEIIGTWYQVSQDEIGVKFKTSDKWVFTADGKCLWYTDNKLVDSSTYTISHYDLANEYDSKNYFLALTDIASGEKFHYWVHGITKDDTNGKYYLSIEFHGGDGIPMVFVKK